MTLRTVPTNVECERPRDSNIAPAMCSTSGKLSWFSAQRTRRGSPRGNSRAFSMACESDRPDSTWLAISRHEASMSAS